MNVTRRDENVPEIEGYIRTVKERVQGTMNAIPFEQIPHYLIVETVYKTCFLVEMFST